LKKKHIELLLIIPALILFAVIAYHYNFIQDDAYITYRYAANYLNGHGLVYNIGERVEGFTNFGWLIYLIMWGSWGVDYIAVSQITGFIFGLGIIYLTFLIGRLLFTDKNKWFVLLPVYLVSVNLSLAYWSPAGLETAAFAFVAMLSVYWYLKRSWLLIFSLALGVWLRPEGALVAGLLLVVEAIMEKGLPRFTLSSTLAALVMSLPLVFFKLFYYGSILPNPFYAKTGFDLEQLSSGLEYAGRFMSHYGFYGFGLVLPLLFIRRLSSKVKVIWLFTVLYMLYIVLVGGDVLKVHRFFIPLLGLSAILVTVSVFLLVSSFSSRVQYIALVVVAVPLLALTYSLPKKFVDHYNDYEKRFTRKLASQAQNLKDSDPRDFSVAIATIGIFGYELMGHDIIDMVGLTDTTIARYSEEPIEGMTTTWKERKHNTKYLLQRAPDYILFSTGIKPSAPAERALFLYPQFLNSYRALGWFYAGDNTDGSGVLNTAFKKMRPIEGEIKPTYPVAYVQYYKTGLDAYTRGDHRTAIQYYDKALAVSPRPYCLDLVYSKARSHMQLGEHNIARPILNNLLKQDSLVYMAHKDLYMYDMLDGDTQKAAIHKKWLEKLVPWYFPRIDSMVTRMIDAKRQAGK
jgi:arabinofuranosyltransferase